MRTVTFSDPAIVKLMNERFVCSWLNKTPDEKFIDKFESGCGDPPRLANGVGVRNVTSIFASNDGTVIHAMPGFLDASSFRKHAEFAQALHAKLSVPGMDRKKRWRTYAFEHLKAWDGAKGRLESQVHFLQAKWPMRMDTNSLRFFDRIWAPVG